MFHKNRYFIMIMLAIAFVFAGFFWSDADDENAVKSLDMSNVEIIAHPVAYSDEDNMVQGLSESVELAVAKPSTNVFHQEDLSPLQGVEDVVLSPDTEPWTSVCLSFHMDADYSDLKVVVTDTNQRIIGEYKSVVRESSASYAEDVETYYEYETTMAGLQPDSNYEYYLVSGDLYSAGGSFKTMSAEIGTTMLFFGDPQGYLKSQYDVLIENYKQAVEAAESDAKDVDLIYVAGDIADSSVPDKNIQEWNYFFDSMKEPLAEHLFVSAIGNHDVYGFDGLYAGNFNYPKNGVEGLEDTNFYFDLPYARVAVWNTEVPSMFERQEMWLKEIMESSNKPFRIVLMHRSAYPMSYNEPYIRDLAAAFEEAGIDLVLSGHDHIYSRTTMGGVTYVVGGSSTATKIYTADTDRDWVDCFYDEEHPVFTVVDIEETWIYIKAYAVEKEGIKLIDEIKCSLQIF